MLVSAGQRGHALSGRHACSMVLARRRLALQLHVHPILRVQRDARGPAAVRSRRPGSARAPAVRRPRESWQYLRIDAPRATGRMRRTLLQRAAAALADLRRACAIGSACAPGAAAAVRRHQPASAAPAARSRLPRAARCCNTWRRTTSPSSAMREYRAAAARPAGCGCSPLPAPASDCCAAGAGIARRTAACRRQHPPGAALARAAGDHQGQRSARPCTGPAISTTSASSASMPRGRVDRRDAHPRPVDHSSAYRADPRQVPWLRLSCARDRAFSVHARQSRRQAPGADPRDAAA